MERQEQVTAHPTTTWDEPKPPTLATALWAERRPTTATLGALELPTGSVVLDADGALLGWSSGVANGVFDCSALWLSLARRFPNTGLWPICDETNVLNSFRSWSPAYWRAPYELASDVFHALTLPDRVDLFCDDYGPQEVLADLVPSATDMRLAAAELIPPNPLTLLARPPSSSSLTLVACRRPSDAALILDFGVPNEDATPGIFAGVLRSWEDRFGLVPVRLHQAWTEFQCLAPPQSPAEIARLAAEVVVFNDDSAWQGGFHQRRGGPSVGAADMVGSREWAIWWD